MRTDIWFCANASSQTSSASTEGDGCDSLYSLRETRNCRTHVSPPSPQTWPPPKNEPRMPIAWTGLANLLRALPSHPTEVTTTSFVFRVTRKENSGANEACQRVRGTQG